MPYGRYSRKATPRRSYSSRARVSRSTGRRVSGRRSTTRRASTGRAQVVRIELVHKADSGLGANPALPVPPSTVAPSKGKAKL